MSDGDGARGTIEQESVFGVPGKPLRVPAVYRDLDAAASRHQRSYGFFLRGHLFLLVLAAAAAGSAGRFGPSAAPVLLFLALGFRYQAMRARDQWHRSRALAERIVSLSWLYVLGVTPFDRSDADSALVERCRAVATVIPGLGSGLADADLQPTAEMQGLRSRDESARIQVYVERRLDEQAVGYYQRKIPFFARRATVFRRLIAALTVITAAILLTQASIEWELDAGGVLVAGLVGMEAWVASRRYSEFATLYASTRAVLGQQRSTLVDAGRSHRTDGLRLAADCEQTLALEQVEWLGMLSFDLHHRVRSIVGADAPDKDVVGRPRISSSQAHEMVSGGMPYRRIGAPVVARQLTRPESLELEAGDRLSGNAGDWVVEGPTGSRVVAEHVFGQTYRPDGDGAYRPTGSVMAIQISAEAEIETLEGWVSARAGDWLVQNPSGECWPVSAEHFVVSYAPEAAPTA